MGVADETAKRGVQHVNELVDTITKCSVNDVNDENENPDALAMACAVIFNDFQMAYPMDDWHHDL